MKAFAILLLAATMSGCVVAPYHPYPVYEPQYEYYWEPSLSLWFYNDGGHRHYQPRGWEHPRYGRGGWHR